MSNRQLHDYPLEERVRSRLDESEIYFPPYKGRDVLEILRKRAEKAFDDNVDEKVLYECAFLSSRESGDCRHALQLLRKAGEVANGLISVSDVRRASNLLQKDHPLPIVFYYLQVQSIFSNRPNHLHPLHLPVK